MKYIEGQIHECPKCHKDHDEPFSYCGGCREYMRFAVKKYKQSERGKEVQRRSAKKWLSKNPDKRVAINKRYREKQRIIMDMEKRLEGYKWALMEAGDLMDDQDVISAYERLFPGSTFTDEGFLDFERGVLDAHLPAETFTVPQAARYLGVSDSYLRRMVRDGKLKAAGEGKNQRVDLPSLAEFQMQRRKKQF